MVGKELEYIATAVLSGEIKGDGPFTHKCNKWMEDTFSTPKVLLTNSCTAALEMTGILADINPGDEVIMPSYTFVSTANAYVLRGAKPIFVDIREDTLNIDEKKIEEKISPNTKIICPVHYAGVGCEMDSILKLAKKKSLLVVEDAAQGVMAKYKGKYLGTLGDLGAYSFHETKNYSAGEGGAILVNNPKYINRSEIIREKGTNRTQFFRGEIDKYGWVDKGSSFLPSDLIAAFLFAQLENAILIKNRRTEIWNTYFDHLKPLEDKGLLSLPKIPEHCEHNSHMFYMLLKDKKQRNNLIQYLKSKGILAVFHYLPLHSSVMGMKYGYKKGDFPISEKISDCIIRLPFYYTLTPENQNSVINSVFNFFENGARSE